MAVVGKCECVFIVTANDLIAGSYSHRAQYS